MATRLSSLPERLKYLQPFRKKFASKPPEELDEDTGVEPLMKLLVKRLVGLTEDEAKTSIQADLTELESWLASPENQNDSLQFVRGFLLISGDEVPRMVCESEAESVKPIREPQMDLPFGAKGKTVKSSTQAGLVFRWNGKIAAIDVANPEYFDAIRSAVTQPADGLTTKATQVRFGPVFGTKFIQTGVTWLGPVKELNYFLEVPGGHVHASASVLSKKIDPSKWDESELEACFASLRIVSRSKP
jgi:hypothetical protein